jgi:hypothetical protein
LERGVTEAFADIVAGIRVRSSVLGCPLNNLALELALSDGDYRKAIDRVFAEWRTVLSERIRQTRGGTRLEPKERAAAANFVISVYSGAMNLAKTSQSAAPLIEAADLLLEWLRARELDSWDPPAAAPPSGDPVSHAKERAHGLLYVASAFQTAFLETVVRDQFVQTTHRAVLAREIVARGWVRVASRPDEPLSLLDLTGSGCVEIGAPTDAVRARNQSAGQALGRTI